MAQDILKSTTTFSLVFQLISSSDHITGLTGKAGSVVVSLSKNGAAGGTPAGAITEVDSTNLPGVYKIAGNATDSGTAGPLWLYAKDAASDPYCALVANVIDPTVANYGANVVNWNNTVVATPATAGIPDINVKNINNTAAATPGASGGILISGSNAGTTTLGALTVTGTMTISDGLVVSRSSANTSAITATGNGTGSGIVATSGAGATGDGIQATAASTNGNGFVMTKTGSGLALKGATTDLTLAKTTNITGFNDIAATAIVSSGAITTSGGAVSTVTTVTNLTNAPTAGDLTATMKTSVASAVLDATAASYNTAGTIGNKINSAASAGDPWSTAVPGAYSAGSAGYILGNGVPLATATQQSIADTILGRNVSGGSSAGRTVKQALHFIRNRWTVSAGTLTVYDTDDSTQSWTSSVTGTAGADPITGNDPA